MIVTGTNNLGYVIYLGFCSSTSHTKIEGTPTNNTINLGKNWIKWNSIYIANEDTLIEDKDFTVDYINGVITFKNNITTSLNIEFDYSDFKQFIIDFKNLRTSSHPSTSFKIDSTKIEKISFTIMPKGYTGNTIAFGEEISYYMNINNISTTNNFLNYENSSLPKNGYNIRENYDKVYNLCPQRVAKEIRKLGYGETVDFYIGSSKYYSRNATKGTEIKSNEDMELQKNSSVLDSFSTWLQNYCYSLIKNGVNEIIIGFSLENSQIPET